MSTPSSASPDPSDDAGHQEPPAPGLTSSSDQGVSGSAESRPDPKLRKEALARIKKQKGAKQLTGVFLIVWAICIAIWFLTPERGHFWPIWVILGTGIALGFSYWGAYGPSETITDAEVEAEMRRMQGGSQ